MKLSIHDKNLLCQHYLNIVYQNTQQYGATHQIQHVTDTYGEILYNAVTKILTHIRLRESDVFFDLGSGLGKVVAQVFLQSPVREACGIELSPTLHQQAERAAQQIQRELPEFFDPERKLSFLLGDFFDVSFEKATVLLLASPCYSPVFLNQLSQLIDQYPNVHTVLTLRPMSGMRRLTFKKAIRVDCSWDAALCYVYR